MCELESVFDHLDVLELGLCSPAEYTYFCIYLFYKNCPSSKSSSFPHTHCVIYFNDNNVIPTQIMFLPIILITYFIHVSSYVIRLISVAYLFINQLEWHKH